MEREEKKQRRVSFASEAPEQNIYDKEMTIVSLTTDEITADLTCEQTKASKSFYEGLVETDKTMYSEAFFADEEHGNKECDAKEIMSVCRDKVDFDDNKENDSLMSNNTAVFNELANTQYIRTIVPETIAPKININEILMDHGIRFLDDIVVSSTRKDTLSKSKKDVESKNIVYYNHFLCHRIKFFEDFSELLKNELLKLSDEIKQIEVDFNIKNTLLEKGDKSMLRSLKSDCRNRANVYWYELRTKKELEFNEFIIGVKNDLINDYNMLEKERHKLKLHSQELHEKIEEIDKKIETFSISDHLTVTNQSINNLKQEIISHERVLEEYVVEYEKVKIDLNNKKISDEVNEGKVNKLRNEIVELEKQFKILNINENDLNDMKNEYEKMTAILGIEIVKNKKNECIFKLMNYEVVLDHFLPAEDYRVVLLNIVEIKYLGTKSIIHEYGVNIIKHKAKCSLEEIIKTVVCLNELSKELMHTITNNSVDLFIEKYELKIVVNVNNVKNFEKYKIKATVKQNMDIVIEKGKEMAVYRLYKDKGCLTAYIQ